MRTHFRRGVASAAGACAAAVLCLAVLSACGGGRADRTAGDGAGGRAARLSPQPAASAPSATPAPGFAPASPPPPAGTFTPSPGSWAGTTPRAGYRVVLLTTDEDAATRVLSRAVREWAGAVSARLTVVRASDRGAYVASIQRAIDAHADLVVTTGHGLVDPLALVTASNLDQQFLVLGAELAEPTLNVTAADWTGASFRGEGLGLPESYDPATFTPERAARAVRAGVTAVLSGLNGTVVWLS